MTIEKPSDADAIIAIVNQLNKINKAKRTVIISDDRYNAMPTFHKHMLIFAGVELINEAKSNVKLLNNDSILVDASLQESENTEGEKPLPPPSQVIQEGIKPPTFELIEQKQLISKNYRIVEKESLFWIEKLMYIEPSSVGTKIKEYWKGKQYRWFNAEKNISMFKKKTYVTLEEAKTKLNDIVETNVTIENAKQSDETKYYYL
jgi:hypothetical protein